VNLQRYFAYLRVWDHADLTNFGELYSQGVLRLKTGFLSASGDVTGKTGLKRIYVFERS